MGTSMLTFHEISTDQCEAARDIREAFGLDKALGYLVGEKLIINKALRGSVWVKSGG
jgi:hypothetical protein